MIISVIAAVAENGVIGTGNGGIPWSMPRDKKHFRNYTAGKWMLLGRVTWQEMDGWFTDQTPVVVSSKTDLDVADGFSVNSIDEGIELARRHDVAELVVSGGASIYEEALPKADKLVITKIHVNADGEKRFPEIHPDHWQMLDEISWDSDRENPYKMSIQTYVPKS